MKRKFITAMFISFILAISVSAENSYDFNQDDVFDTNDITILQSSLVKKNSELSENLSDFDTDEDGKVNIFDLIICKRALNSTNQKYQPVEVPTQKGNYTFNGFDYTYQDTSLPIREAKIGSMDNSENVKLVIYLHGGHSCGTDNQAQLEDTALKNIADYLSSQQMNAILLAPQCSKDHLWTYKPNKQLLKSLIDSYTLNNTVNKDKIFMLGASAGGTGTWNMIADYPDLFCAAMPSVSSPEGLSADDLSQTPVCVVLGENDVMFPPEEVEPLIETIKSSGGEVLYQIRENCKHPQACETAFTDECLEWVLNR